MTRDELRHDMLKTFARKIALHLIRQGVPIDEAIDTAIAKVREEWDTAEQEAHEIERT